MTIPHFTSQAEIFLVGLVIFNVIIKMMTWLGGNDDFIIVDPAVKCPNEVMNIIRSIKPAKENANKK